MSDNDDDSDEWAVDDLPDLPLIATAAAEKDGGRQGADDPDDDDEGWECKLPPPSAAAQQATKASNKTSNSEKVEQQGGGGGGNPMIIVDMTQLSRGAIHSKFDANAVNDPVAVKKLRLKIEKEYTASYTKNNADLLADGTVIPCGSSVWRPALERLRRERPGHYFCPIFPLLSQQK